MSLRVDCREAKLIERFAEMQYPIVIEQLPVADAVVVNSAGSSVALLERKTFSDFCSSLTSGRYKEQRNRLLSVRESEPRMQLAYILEGYPQWPAKMRRDVPLQKRIYGALENMVFKHGISLFPTNDVDHTCETLKHLATKLAEESDTVLSTPLPARKVTIKEHLFPSQLALIPGISVDTASSISRVLYKSAHELVVAIQSDRASVCDALAAHSSKSRKLGRAKAMAVVDAFS